MAKPVTRHRDGLEEHTECGIPLNREGLLYQPSDGSGDPVTCGRCLKLLTHDCFHCKETVTCYREEFTDHMGRTQHLIFRCPECHRRTEWGHYPGQRPQQRKRRAWQKINKEARSQQRDETDQRWKEELAQEKAARAEFGISMDSCAICDLPLPERIVRRQWNQTIPEQYRFTEGGWRRSIHVSVGFVYCPDHIAEGQELDVTLTVAFRSVAAEIQAAVSDRARRATWQTA